MVLEVEEIEKSPIGSVKVAETLRRFNPIELSDISIAELLSLVKGDAKKYIPKYQNQQEEAEILSQKRIETPSPSALLKAVIRSNERYKHYGK